MSAFLDNANKIFDVARSAPPAENADFALYVGSDGSLRIQMEPHTPADWGGWGAAYRVVRSGGAVRVIGQSFDQTCILEDRKAAGGFPRGALLRDQPLYTVGSAMRLE